MNIDPDDLVVPALYQIYADKKYPVNEATVEKCLDPSRPFEHHEAGRWLQPSHEQVVGILRSSILHLVSAEETTKILLSAGDYPMPELPPLPYPRIAIEALETGGWLVESTGGQHLSVYAIFLSEREQGRVWDCLWYWGDAEDYDRPYSDDERYVPFLAWTIRATPGKEGFHVSGAYEGHPANTAHISDEPGKVLVKFAIELAQVISADNVPHEPVRHVSRQQRRKWQHKHPYVITTDKPRIYYVNLAHAGEQSHEEGDGSRVYHVRWLVRGHWRHLREDARRMASVCLPRKPRGSRLTCVGRLAHRGRDALSITRRRISEAIPCTCRHDTCTG